MKGEFKITSLAVHNRTTVFFITIIITLTGIFSYLSLPKEQFPEVVIPTIFVGTPYPGTSPLDMENLVTRPIEKELKSINNVKEIQSISVQDFSTIVVEFETNIDVVSAKQEVTDAVDRALSELPQDLPQNPDILEVDFSEFPIQYVNVSGDFEMSKLKEFAENLQDEIESLSEIRRVDIVGALDREIQVNVDLYRMQASKITFDDIERTIAGENVTISSGQLDNDGVSRTVRVEGEFSSVEELQNIKVRSSRGAVSYLKDIADVLDSYEDRESYARLNDQSVITLNIIKKSGENLIDASDKIKTIIDEFQKTKFPEGLDVVITGDQSRQTRNSVSNLFNTVIVGFMFVVIVLMFFMGIKNAIFVGIAIPVSALMAFIVMPPLGFTLNIVTLFSLILALGIVVDNSIVVVENTYRYYSKENYEIKKAAKVAAGEVALPVITGTLTTMAPFIPLMFWGGIIGKFMIYLPVTICLTLVASIGVALIMNPVFAVAFMHERKKSRRRQIKGLIISSVGLVILSIIAHLLDFPLVGNLSIIILIINLLSRIVIERLIKRFQNSTLPRLIETYKKVIEWMLKGRRSIGVILITLGLLVGTFVLAAIMPPKIIFFPQGDPNFIYVYNSMPIGTDIEVTDSITLVLEEKVIEVLGENNPMVESIISNVSVGVRDQQDQDRSEAPHKSKISIAFVEFQYRNGVSTSEYLEKIRQKLQDVPGAEISVEKERAGPPTGKPINLEIIGEDFDELSRLATRTRNYLDSLQIPGIEELKSDLEVSKPEIRININRTKANELGIGTAQAGLALRTALFGKEVSQYREFEDEYPIMVRLQEDYRDQIQELIDMRIAFMDLSAGGVFKSIPLSSVADFEYTRSIGSVRRLDLDRVVTLSSNVLTDYNANEINSEIRAALTSIPLEEGYSFELTGEQEEQKETAAFLAKALFAAVGLIFLILITQFNSISKPLIIMTQVVLSVIGVLLGFIFTGLEFSVVLTGMGVVSVAGIVVKNGIIMIDYIDELKNKGVGTVNAIRDASAIRLSPVLLTAASTILGLVPLAVGMNINFYTLFNEFNPQIYFGGDNSVFWGPLAWTIIFGLSFATFLTLFVVPSMYYAAFGLKVRIKKLQRKLNNR